MINNIKPKIIYVKIFLLLEEEIKLNIIRYNKLLQNKLGINIQNYKNFGKILTIDENGNGEIRSFDNILFFKGTYLNKKKNGFGKEYGILHIFYGDIPLEKEKYIIQKGFRKSKGKQIKYVTFLIYEGEYRDGKKEGKGKEFNKLKIIPEYEGEFKNGKREGKGKKFNDSGNIIFEGEFKEGKEFSGYKREYSRKKLSFEG